MHMGLLYIAVLTLLGKVDLNPFPDPVAEEHMNCDI